MMNANPQTKIPYRQSIKDIESVLFKPQIDSHQSNYANYRLHLLETAMDVRRSAVIEMPSVDNIVGYWAVLEANFSYLRSIIQRKLLPDSEDLFEQKVLRLEKIKGEITVYWNFFKFGIKEDLILSFERNNPRNYQRLIQSKMVSLCNEFSDLLRVSYQSLSYYFRQNKVKKNLGIEGDLIRSKLMQLKSISMRGRFSGGNVVVLKGKLLKQQKRQGLEAKDGVGTIQSES